MAMKSICLSADHGMQEASYIAERIPSLQDSESAVSKIRCVNPECKRAPAMFLFSKTSYPKRLHTQQCPYASRIKKENIISVHGMNEATPSCQPCFLCSKLGRMYRKERRDIEAFCMESQFSCQWKDGYIQIDGPVESWRIVYSRSQRRIAIYHKNSTLYKPKTTDFPYETIDGYHRQHWQFRSILSALRAMLNHQWSYLERDGLPMGMKQHVSSLLPQKVPRPGLSKKRKRKEARAAKHFENRQKAIRVLKIIEQWER